MKTNVLIEFNVKSGELKSANKELDSTQNKIQGVQKRSSAFTSGIGKLTLTLGAATLAAQGLSTLKDILSAPIAEAISLNAQYENLNNSIASLISINHKNITTTGEVLSTENKWQASLKLASRTIEELKIQGLELGYSIGDMSDMFKGFYSTAGASMSLQEAKEAMKAIAAAANVSGVSVDSLKVTLDNLGSGIADTATDFGRFIKAMGLSTESMQKAKNEGKLYGLIMEKLGPLGESAAFSANSYAVNMAKLNSVIEDLKASALAPYFESIKASIASATQFLSMHKDEIVRLAKIIIAHAQEIAKPFVELANVLWDHLSVGLQFVAKCFSSASREGEEFSIILDILESISVVLVTSLSKVVNTIKLAINSFKLLINSAQMAYYTISNVLSLGLESDIYQPQIAALLAKDKELRAAMMDNIKDYGEIFGQGVDKIQAIWSDKTPNLPLPRESEIKLLSKNPSGNITPQSSIGKEIEQLDRLKSYLENELLLRGKNIALMTEGKQKELELEKIRYEGVITHLNLELNKKLQSGAITLSQANALYDVELRAHEQKMRHIQEYSQTLESLKSNINSALDENINNALNGKFNGFQDLFIDMFNSIQSSITKGFANSIAQAFMESQVMESMTKTLSNVLDSVSGKGASGGLAGMLANAGDSTMQTIGSVAGISALVMGGDALLGSLFKLEQDERSNVSKKDATLIAGALSGGIGAFLPGFKSLIQKFSTTKIETLSQGVELFSNATKTNINAKEYAEVQETKKKWWGLSKKTNTYTNYYDPSQQSLRVIQESIRGYEHLLQDIGGGIKELSIQAGRYDSYSAIANEGAKELIKAFFEAPSTALKNQGAKTDIDAIYRVWEEYAKSINQEVNEALQESLKTYVSTGENFQGWLYGFKGQESKALKYQAQLYQTQVDRIMQSLGVSDINIDNYLAYREEAIKQGFDPQSIQQINALGEALMQSAEASKKYEEALKGENKTKLNLIDPYLQKAKKLEDFTLEQNTINEKLQVNILTTLKTLLRVNQESLELQGSGK